MSLASTLVAQERPRIENLGASGAVVEGEWLASGQWESFQGEDLNDDGNTDDTVLDLTKAVLRGAKLARANLVRSNLSEAELRGANLSGTDLERADLTGSDLARCDLTVDVLYRARLTRALLGEANLEGVRNWMQVDSITGADLHRVENAPAGFLPWARENGASSEELEFIPTAATPTTILRSPSSSSCRDFVTGYFGIGFQPLFPAPCTRAIPSIARASAGSGARPSEAGWSILERRG